jgi:prepilin-type processing-associated H-X9-DG protein
MSEIRVDTISEKTSANGVSIDGLTIKDGGITATTGAIVFNEASADVDFRVESNGNANMLFVDGGNDKVGIGTNAPAELLEVEGTAAAIQIDSNGDSALRFATSGTVKHSIYSSSGALNFFDNTNSANRWQIDSTGNLVPQSTSLGIYLGVSSATASNLLDDYEEGTWTPAWNSGANGRSISGTGGYTKIGNLVTVFGYFEIGGSNDTGSGDVSFSGLPFTSSSVTAQRAAISILVLKCASNVDGYISGFVEDNSQLFYVREGGIVAAGNDLGNHFDQDSEFYLSASYRV